MSSRAIVRPSVPSSAHLHCQGLDIHRRMVTATANKYMQWLRKKINDVQSSTSSSSIVIVTTSIFRPYHRPKCPSVPSSAHLHRQRHMLDIHRRMVTATVSVLSVVEKNKFKNMLKVQLAKQIKRSSSLRRIRLYMELWNTFAILAIFDFPI